MNEIETRDGPNSSFTIRSGDKVIAGDAPLAGGASRPEGVESL